MRQWRVKQSDGWWRTDECGDYPAHRDCRGIHEGGLPFPQDERGESVHSDANGEVRSSNVAELHEQSLGGAERIFRCRLANRTGKAVEDAPC